MQRVSIAPLGSTPCTGSARCCCTWRLSTWRCTRPTAPSWTPPVGSLRHRKSSRRADDPATELRRRAAGLRRLLAGAFLSLVQAGGGAWFDITEGTGGLRRHNRLLFSLLLAVTFGGGVKLVVLSL
uniref:Uncharacterized protein n=1 Tax=Heterosigma akashiwo TaxID=2829 RepID=A0A6V1WIA6_HETAK